MPENRKIFNSKSVFQISVIVIILTILGVWLFGLGTHNTVFKNSILSTSILSLSFFSFISFGLYKGAKLKDNLGKITNQFDNKKIEHLKNFDLGFTEVEFLEVGEEIEGLIVGVFVNVLLWILASLFFAYFIWAFSAFFWIVILIFIAMLYWIFFRALRMVFKKSVICKGKMSLSMIYAFAYTILYNFWIYGIIWIVKIANN